MRKQKGTRKPVTEAEIARVCNLVAQAENLDAKKITLPMLRAARDRIEAVWKMPEAERKAIIAVLRSKPRREFENCGVMIAWPTHQEPDIDDTVREEAEAAIARERNWVKKANLVHLFIEVFGEEPNIVAAVAS